jgi:hypothetical protein
MLLLQTMEGLNYGGFIDLVLVWYGEEVGYWIF